jgi:hypothetical protein
MKMKQDWNYWRLAGVICFGFIYGLIYESFQFLTRVFATCGIIAKIIQK